jgi:UDP-glucuronate 4-epimerase
MNKDTVLISGAAGFIGSSLAYKLASLKFKVIGFDNFAPNYSRTLKEYNLQRLRKFSHFKFYEMDILNKEGLKNIIFKHAPGTVFHLAALTGVRQSLKTPKEYELTNIVGTKNIYKIVSRLPKTSFIFASSSSVYGKNDGTPFKEDFPLSPQSPYAKTKTLAELEITNMYGEYSIPTVITRFFSVYGPYGRPDMAPYLFTKAALTQQPIVQIGIGNTARDYTYIDDVTSALLKLVAHKNPLTVVNIGSSAPVTLSNLISMIEKIIGKPILRTEVPYDKTESFLTYADISRAKSLLSWHPKVSIEEGLYEFVQWYKSRFSSL